MNSDTLKIYLPKFLSAESDKILFEELNDFPDNIDSRLYTSALQDSNIIFQGDGLKDLLIINLPDENIQKRNSLVISNTCDIDPNNKRLFPSQVVYAPILSLAKYKNMLLSKSSKTKQQIESHIETIKKQKVTQIFYLPSLNDRIDESIVFLDRVNNCSVKSIVKVDIKQDRIFTLSNYGAYIFILKLSIHYTRIQDKVDRNEGKY